MTSTTVANSIFLGCLLVGGGLLLVTVVVGDLVGGILDAVHLGVDVGGVGLMPMLLGFVSMFGVGGLFGTEVMGLDTGASTLIGTGTGVLGAGIVYAMFTLLGRSEGPEPFSLQDLVGQTARVSVGIRAGHFGTVQLSFAGQSHELTATSDVDIGAGSVVKVESVAGSNLVVTPASPAKTGGEQT
jgi:membrane-bound ClpP family serine protease